ncbi:hypothetical protein TNCV_3826551 [Trichonephila clavipes]|nr:hypothetical protein TNCV_3826551 [Trichonephila clavipes]
MFFWYLSRTDKNTISIYERKILFLEEFKKMTFGKEDQSWSSITRIKNLTSLTSSKYNELIGRVTLSEWTKTAPLKKSLMPNQLAHGGEKAGQISDGMMA